MIRRYDAYSEGQEDDGRFVFYEDHLAEIAEKDKEIKRLTESLIYYVKESYKGAEVA